MNIALLITLFAYSASILQTEHYLPWVSWHSEVAGFFAAFTLIVAIARAKSILERGYIQTPVLVIFPFALMVIATIQWLFGLIVFRGDLIVLMIYLAPSAMVLVAGYEAGRNEGKSIINRSLYLEGYCAVVVLLAVLSTFIALAQVLEVGDKFTFILQPLQPRRPGANIGQPNHLGTLLVTGLVALCILKEKRLISAVPFGILMLVLGGGVTLTESRTALLSLFTVTLLPLYFQLINRKYKKLVLLVLYVAAIFLGAFVWPKVLNLYQSGDVEGNWAVPSLNTSAGTRLIVWPQLLDAATKNPIFGWGLREVSRAHNEVLANYALSEPFTYSHNIIIDMVLGLGIPATLILAYMGVRGLRQVFRGRITSRRISCICLMLPFTLHSLLEFPFSYSYFLFPNLFILGLLLAEMDVKPVIRMSILVFQVILVISVVMAAWSSFEYVKVEADFRVARFESSRIGETPNDYLSPQIFLLDQLSALNQVSRITPREGMPPESILLLKKVAQRFPWTAVQNRYALALALNGYPDKALEQIQVMKAMHGEDTHERLMKYWLLRAKEYPYLLGLLGVRGEE